MGNLVEGLSHPLFKEILYKQNTDDYLIPCKRVSDSCLLSEREPTRARWCVDTAYNYTSNSGLFSDSDGRPSFVYPTGQFLVLRIN